MYKFSEFKEKERKETDRHLAADFVDNASYLSVTLNVP